mgnify:CR=1 FL=1
MGLRMWLIDRSLEDVGTVVVVCSGGAVKSLRLRQSMFKDSLWKKSEPSIGYIVSPIWKV